MSLLALSGFSPLNALSSRGHYEQHLQFVGKISAPDQFDPLETAQMVQNQDLSITVEWLQKWCYDLISFGITGTIRYHPNREAEIRTVCPRINLQVCITFLSFLNTRQPLSGHPVNTRLFLEELLIRYGELFPSTSPGFNWDMV